MTKWFAYSQYEQKRAQAPAVTPPSSATSSSAVMFDSRICCHHNCLGRVLTGTDAVKEFFRRRDKATTQAQRQELVDTFLVTFPGVCVAATQIVLNVGQKLVQSRRKRIKQGNLPGPSVHGLKVYRERNPMYRIDPSLDNKVNVFLDTYFVGNPISETRRAHINAVVSVNGKQGLWKMFMRQMSQIPRSTFNAVLARWLKFHGFTGLDRTHVDHNVCPTCRDLTFKEERTKLYLAEALRPLNEALVSDDANDDERIEAIQMRLNTLQEELAVLQREKAEHAEFNAHCRSIVAWWRCHAIKAHNKWEKSSRSRSRSPARSPERACEPLICMLHCDGEASRKIPVVLTQMAVALRVE